ncbi:hypothetical protein FIM12_04600 [SAR202 cluster bacterium AD-804-J14_MRT_500m]|nr:hypothetical protein [SAR202 cluster bacterium AD-804-J14_MRT_500m]
MYRLAPILALLILLSILACEVSETPPAQPSPTPDLDATIQARLQLVLDSTPSPSPTATPVKSPDIDATVQARLQLVLDSTPSPSPTESPSGISTPTIPPKSTSNTTTFEEAQAWGIRSSNVVLHIGETAPVCGEVAFYVVGPPDGYPSVDPLVLVLDQPPPHPLLRLVRWARSDFTVVIWGASVSKGNFQQATGDSLAGGNPFTQMLMVAAYYEGKNICVTGLISSYQGVPAIEVFSSLQILIAP